MGWSTHHPNGLIHYALQNSYRGYTLVSNLGGHHANLIDMEGRVCHTWRSDEGIGYGYLLPDGHLLPPHRRESLSVEHDMVHIGFSVTSLRHTIQGFFTDLESEFNPRRTMPPWAGPHIIQPV